MATATARPPVRLRTAWLAYILLVFANNCHAILSPADTEQLVILLQSSQPDFEPTQNEPCSEQGLSELQQAGVYLVCTMERDTQDQQCEKIRLDGAKHTGVLSTDIQFPALVEFEVHNTLLIEGLPAALVAPQLQLLSFKNNTKLRSSLPPEWGVATSGNASFPALKQLSLEHGMWEGTLPGEWGGNISFPELVRMTITGPKTYLPSDPGLAGGIPSGWLAPGSFSLLQNIDVSYNSLSGLIPDALLGIPDADTADAQLPFHYLQSVKIFQQWGSRMCAHVHSNANIPAVPPRLDLGNASSPIASDILKYMKGQAAPVSSTDSQACDRSGAADALLRAAGSQLSENVEWLGGGVSTMLTATPFFMFPWDQDQGQTPQEVFIGLCDLPEMLSLADALRFDVTSQNTTCEATLNYCDWAGVDCMQTQPPSAQVQSIAVASEAALQELPDGITEVGPPLPKRDEASFAYMPHFSRAGVLPGLAVMALGTEVWGVLPDSWSTGSQLRNLKAVYLLGDNFIHALTPGWFEPSTAGMQLRNITVATTVSIGCLPTSILSGPSVTSLQVVPAPSYGKFPNIQKAMNCPIPAFPDEQLATGYSGSDVPYSTIKQMQVLRIDATRSVLDLASLGCSTDGSECPVESPTPACTVQLQQLVLAGGNRCGEGYLLTALGCPLCGEDAARGCQDSCQDPPDLLLCRWRSEACSEQMNQLRSKQARLRQEAFRLTVPEAARDIESGAYALALSGALVAGAEDLGSSMVGRPRVQGLIVSSGRSACQSGAEVVVASLAGLAKELPDSERFADALMRPSLLLAPVLCGAGESTQSGAQLQGQELAVLSPPDVPATHVLVEIDTIEWASGADRTAAGRKLLNLNESGQRMLERILGNPNTATVFMQSLEEVSVPANLRLSADSIAAKDLLPEQTSSEGENGTDEEKEEGFMENSVMVSGLFGGLTALVGVLCCGCWCLQRRKARGPHHTVHQYVEISESRALPCTNSEGPSPAVSLGPRERGPEAVRGKMEWLKGLAGTRRQQGSSRDRAAWSKFDQLLNVMTCASRLPVEISPEDSAVPPRSTPAEMVQTGVRESFTEPPMMKTQYGAGRGNGRATGNKRSPVAPDPEAVAKEIAANKDALSALVLKGPEARKHAALRVASAYDSLFSDDPFGIYRTSPFQTPLWEILLSYRREEGPFKEHMLPARRFHCVGKGGFDSGVAELQELQKNRLAVIHEFRSLMSSEPMTGMKLQRASTSGVPLSASSMHAGTPLAHVDEERTSDVQDRSENSNGEEDSTRAGSLHMSPQLSAAASSLTPAVTAPPGRLPSSSLGSGSLPAHRAQSATPPGKVPRYNMLGESGPLSEDKVNQRERQYLDIIGQGSFPGQIPRPGSASLPSGSTPELPLVTASISQAEDPVTITNDSAADAPAVPELPRFAAEQMHAQKGSAVSAPITRSFSWPYCQSLASMDFQALARDEDGFLRTSASKDDGQCLDHGLFLGTDPRHPTVLLGSVYFVGDRQKARLNREAENANAPYKPPDRVMGAPQPSTELPAVVTAAVAAASSRRIAARTARLQGASDRVTPELSSDVSRLAHSAARDWRHGGDSQSSLTTPPSRSATLQAGTSGTDDQVTTHSGLLAKLSTAFAHREQMPDQHQVYIPPDGLDDNTTAVQSSAGPTDRVQPQDDGAMIQQALQMCDTDQIQGRESLGATGGMAWGAAPGRAGDSMGAAPPGAGGYMKLEDVMNGRLPGEAGGGYPVSGGPQAAIDPPDKVSVRYDQHSEAGIDTAFNVLLECFGMMQWQGPAREIAVSMLEDLKSHVSAQHDNRSILDEQRLDLADLDMTSFRADEELGKDIVEPPAAQTEDRNKNAHLGLGLGKLTPLAEDSESDKPDRRNAPRDVSLAPRMPSPSDRDMCIEPTKLTYISLLGRGAFGEVHYGTWEAPDGQVHDVAIKVLLATRYGSLQECDKDRKKFVTEMQLMMRMTHHSIVRCFGGAMARHDGENDFMVLEYIPGGTLDHYVHEHRRESRLTLGEVLVIATDLADVLRYLHRLGVVHQDLKPSNILLNEHGEVKLTDFGISKIKRSTCLSQCMVGTPSYTAPEVWVGDQVNEKCDIFALGILLWECMTGTRPFKNMHAFQIMMHLQTNQTRGEDWLPFPKHTPPEFKRLVRRCWHAENRFRISADEALASAVLLRSTIHDATQSVPVELDVGLLPENHSQGVLIPSNGMSRKKQVSKRRKRASPSDSPQVSGGVNRGRPALESTSGGRDHAGRAIRNDRRYQRSDSRPNGPNVYVPSSPTGSRDTSRTKLPPVSGQPVSPETGSTAFRAAQAHPPAPPNPTDHHGQSTGKASWADWSIQDSNSKAVQPMWNIGFGGDTTSNLGGSTFQVGAGLESAMSNVSDRRTGLSSRIKPPVSSSSAQGRTAAASRMPAVLESTHQASVGSEELDAQLGSAKAAPGGDSSNPEPSAVAEADSRQGKSPIVSVEMARMASPLEPGAISGLKPAVNGSPLAMTRQSRAAEPLAPLGFTASRAKSPQESEMPLTEEFHLPLAPVPSAHQSTVHITDSAALPASGQLSHTRQLSRPFVGMGPSKASGRPGPKPHPWAPSSTSTVTDVTLPPSVIDENSRQALAATIPGPSLHDAWKMASKGQS